MVLAASVADRDSVAAREADRMVVIGPAAARASYLDARLMVHAAKSTGCDGLHPGYGFLSERSSPAALCEQEGIAFVGPSATSIEAVGDKLAALRLAKAAGSDDDAGERQAGKRRGRGRLRGRNRLPRRHQGVGRRRRTRHGRRRGIPDRFATGSRAPRSRPRRPSATYSVRELRRARASRRGAGRRRRGWASCSFRRTGLLAATPLSEDGREAPAVALPAPTRARLHKAAVDLLAAINYRNAGTAEFLYDVDRDEFYFMEVNARIQVASSRKSSPASTSCSFSFGSPAARRHRCDSPTSR